MTAPIRLSSGTVAAGDVELAPGNLSVAEISQQPRLSVPAFEPDRAPQEESEKSGASFHPSVSAWRLLKHADRLDYLYMVLGTVGGIGDGLQAPISYYIATGLVKVLSRGSAISPETFNREVKKYVVSYVFLALGGFASSFLEASCWMLTGERQVSRLRSMYLRSVLRQNEEFFDTSRTNSAEVVNVVAADTVAIEDALSEKMGLFICCMAHFLGGYIVALYLAWKLILVTVPFAPLLIVPSVMFGKRLASANREMHKGNLAAANVAEQAISSIRTVFSFIAEKKTMEMFSRSLDASVRIGLKVGWLKGLAMGAHGISFGIWGFLCWYGGRLVVKDELSPGNVVFAGLAFVQAGIALGSALPIVPYFVEGRAAVRRIFGMIDTVPDIDADNVSGEVLQQMHGSMELRGVCFNYPTRPETPILDGFSLIFPAGSTVALVGESGCGKSTVIALLERFYDPIAGQVLIDGVNIKDLQLKWLRTQIGLVSQEPALFATSVKDNIMFGKEGASMEEVQAAAKAANAHNFIQALPDSYDTQVGERGVQMSGGQKQRIAIARALLKNPPILLLDEATSALDAESERAVQQALDAASIGRTTVVVAHRLSTIRTADTIAVVRDGRVVELGPHDELLLKEGGAYAALINLYESRETRDRDRESPYREGPERSSLEFRSSKSNSAVYPSSDNADFAVDGAKPQNSAHPPAKSPSFSRLLRMSKPEWRQALLGSAGGVSYGFIQPLYAYFLGYMLSVYKIADHDRLSRDAGNTALVFFGLGVGCCIANLVQHHQFTVMGELLAKRVREAMLSRILTFEVGWFDRDENSSGAVCSHIVSEANVVRSLVGDRLSLVMQTSAAILISFAVGLVTTWRLALVMIAVIPITIACFYVKRALLVKTYALTKKAQESGSQVASEAVTHHRTIAAFTAQDKVIRLFESMQSGAREEARRRALYAGLGLGAASFAMYATWALDFWWGGELIARGQLDHDDLFKCFLMLVSTGKMIGIAGSMTLDLAKGTNSVRSVFDILDRRTRIDSDDAEGLRLDPVKGNIELKSVDFAYPSRSDVMVFRNLNLQVQSGRSMALVGQSGCGKSTIVGLVERFYDPLAGQVLIDGHCLKSLHLRSIRARIALVSQEPTLVSGSIRENILFGRQGASEAEMIEAARAANALSFISGLEAGFETYTGERGVQMSGGQKQRIAIARAILKNPAILLLDEATSALDAQSEKLVQEALDRMTVGRTTIIVAHRLSTICNCDSIAVIHNGSVVEQGNHSELLARGDTGLYSALVKTQQES